MKKLDFNKGWLCRPLTRAGFWRVVCRNRFLHVEWVQRAEDGLAWPLLFTWRRLPPESGT